MPRPPEIIFNLHGEPKVIRYGMSEVMPINRKECPSRAATVSGLYRGKSDAIPLLFFIGEHGDDAVSIWINEDCAKTLVQILSAEINKKSPPAATGEPESTGQRRADLHGKHPTTRYLLQSIATGCDNR